MEAERCLGERGMGGGRNANTCREQEWGRVRHFEFYSHLQFGFCGWFVNQAALWLVSLNSLFLLVSVLGYFCFSLLPFLFCCCWQIWYDSLTVFFIVALCFVQFCLFYFLLLFSFTFCFVLYFIVWFFILLCCLLFLSVSMIASNVQKFKNLRLFALCTYIELQLLRAALSLGPGQTALKSLWLI